jgi:DNA gyrase inhibitor GyrI
MSTREVQITQLKPMRVASAYGFGEHPEKLAWQQMVKWAQPKGFLRNIQAHPIFGFNNPYPTPEAPQYGYEFWIKVEQEVESEGTIRIVEFLGGKYAVTRCDVNGHPESIPESWQHLAKWCNDNNHPLAQHPALEQFLGTPDDLEHLVLMLHCPISS